ncbi:MAG: type II CRISPR-associated endonuclease Cas1, partial [Flavobacteriaceae bacterium]
KGVPPNNLLNYGYAVLRAVTARALVSSGMLPSVGIFHRNKYNAFCLADDIMEPYRIYVDALVYEMVEAGGDISELSPILKAELLTLPAMNVFIDGKWSPLMNAMSRTTNSLYECFLGDSRKLLYPEFTINSFGI